MEPKQGTTAESENTVIVCEHDDIDSKGLPIFLLNFVLIKNREPVWI